MMKSHRRRLACVLIALGTLASACSSGNGNDKSATPTSTTSASTGFTTLPAAPKPRREAEHEWKFHIRQADGWEYDATFKIGVTIKFEKDTEFSPPGKAKLVQIADGETSLNVKPATEGRTPPAFDYTDFDYEVLLNAPDLPADRTLQEMLYLGQDVGVEVMTCSAGGELTCRKSGDGAIATEHKSVYEYAEADVDRFLALTAKRSYVGVTFFFDGTCEMRLTFDGSIGFSPDYDGGGKCVVTPR